MSVDLAWATFEMTEENFLRFEKALQGHLRSVDDGDGRAELSIEAHEMLMKQYNITFQTNVHGKVTVHLPEGMSVEEFDIMCAELLMTEK